MSMAIKTRYPYNKRDGTHPVLSIHILRTIMVHPRLNTSSDTYYLNAIREDGREECHV